MGEERLVEWGFGCGSGGVMESGRAWSGAGGPEESGALAPACVLPGSRNANRYLPVSFSVGCHVCMGQDLPRTLERHP